MSHMKGTQQHLERQFSSEAAGLLRELKDATAAKTGAAQSIGKATQKLESAKHTSGDIGAYSASCFLSCSLFGSIVSLSAVRSLTLSLVSLSAHSLVSLSAPCHTCPHTGSSAKAQRLFNDAQTKQQEAKEQHDRAVAAFAERMPRILQDFALLDQSCHMSCEVHTASCTSAYPPTPLQISPAPCWGLNPPPKPPSAPNDVDQFLNQSLGY